MSARLLLLCLLLLPVWAQAQWVHESLPPPDPPQAQSFRALAFGDASDAAWLRELFAWLRQQDQRPVSLQQIVEARAGGKALPPRALLLSFDGAHRSVQERVLPLLREFGYPAVVALSTWQVESGEDDAPDWRALRELSRSGLVELATQGHDLQRRLPGTPQGDLLPAATTAAWKQGFETPAQQSARIEADLRRSRELIGARTGARVRAVAWPEGAWNEAGVAAAARAGLPIALTLDPGPNPPDWPLDRIRRMSSTPERSPAAHLELLRQTAAEWRPIHRSLQFDAAAMAEPARLERALARLRRIEPSLLFLRAEAQDGRLAHLVAQLRTRAGVKVFAELPPGSDYAELARRVGLDGLVVAPAQAPAAQAARPHRPALQLACRLQDPAQLEVVLRACDLALLSAPLERDALRRVIRRVAAVPQGRERTIFELPARRADGQPVQDTELARAFSLLQRHTMRSHGYAPDDFLAGRPDAAVARDALSKRERP